MGDSYLINILQKVRIKWLDDSDTLHIYRALVRCLQVLTQQNIIFAAVAYIAATGPWHAVLWILTKQNSSTGCSLRPGQRSAVRLQNFFIKEQIMLDQLDCLLNQPLRGMGLGTAVECSTGCVGRYVMKHPGHYPKKPAILTLSTGRGGEILWSLAYREEKILLF